LRVEVGAPGLVLAGHSGHLLAAALSVHELAAFGGDGPVGLHEHDLSLVGQRIL
jgi:hypothetical protein